MENLDRKISDTSHFQALYLVKQYRMCVSVESYVVTQERKSTYNFILSIL